MNVLFLKNADIAQFIVDFCGTDRSESNSESGNFLLGCDAAVNEISDPVAVREIEIIPPMLSDFPGFPVSGIDPDAVVLGFPILLDTNEVISKVFNSAG